jgi:hypothetical protein
MKLKVAEAAFSCWASDWGFTEWSAIISAPKLSLSWFPSGFQRRNVVKRGNRQSQVVAGVLITVKQRMYHLSRPARDEPNNFEGDSFSKKLAFILCCIRAIRWECDNF